VAWIVVFRDSGWVAERIGLNVHCNIVNESLIDEGFKCFWPAAVCVEFDQETHLFYFSAQQNKLLLKCWFSAGNNHAVNKALVAFKELMECLFIKEACIGSPPLRSCGL